MAATGQQQALMHLLRAARFLRQSSPLRVVVRWVWFQSIGARFGMVCGSDSGTEYATRRIEAKWLHLLHMTHVSYASPFRE